MLLKVAIFISWLLDTLSEDEVMYLQIVAERDLLTCAPKSDMAKVLQAFIDLVNGRNWSEEEEAVEAVKDFLDCN